MNFDNLVQVFLRLKALLDQHDNSEKNLAELEMQQEVLSRIGQNSEELIQARAMTASGVKTLLTQREAAQKAIEDFTGLTTADLRERVSEIGVRIEQLSGQALEEKKLRAGFEILVETNSFTEDEGETRAEFEERLSYAKNIKETAFRLVVRLVTNSLNKKSIVVPTDSVLKKLWKESDDLQQLSKLIKV